MFSGRSICLLTTLGALIPAASAQDECSALDPLLSTVDTVHEIRLDRPGTMEEELLTDLAFSLAAVSLTDIYSHTDGPSAEGEREALTRYVDALRKAVGRQVPARELRAQVIFKQDVPAGARRELSRLQQQLGCLEEPPVQTSPPKEAAPPQYEARPLGPLSLEARDQPSGPRRLQALQLDSAYDPAARKVEFERASHLYSWALPALSTLILLGCFGTWLHPRIRRWRLRDERRTCYVHVPIRYGGRAYTMTIIDYTPDGLRLKHDGRIGRRRRISLHLEESWIKGKVAWSNSVHAGVGLFSPMTPEQISYLAGESIAGSAERCGEEITVA